jgi:L-fuconolactonase
MLTIDAHQHFWKYNTECHAWIDDNMKAIRKDFLPNDLKIILEKNNVEGCVAVQADQTEAETNFLLQAAKENSFIKGVVGWVDLRASDLKERLDYYSQFEILKGFRHILQGELPEFMLQPSFVNGIAQLEQFNFTYDILIFPQHLETTLQLVKKFPHQKFVIDHLAKPFIKTNEIEEWKKGMQELANYENVFCKISGMVTEADWKTWNDMDLKPYLDTVVDAFGTNRLMFGSDWPVCLVAASFDQWLETVKNYFQNFSQTEQENIFYHNTKQFYQL